MKRNKIPKLKWKYHTHTYMLEKVLPTSKHIGEKEQKYDKNNHMELINGNYSVIETKTRSISMVSKPFVFEVFVVKSAQ